MVAGLYLTDTADRVLLVVTVDVVVDKVDKVVLV